MSRETSYDGGPRHATETTRAVRTDRPGHAEGRAHAEGRTQAPWVIVFLRELVVKLTDRNFLISTAVTIGAIALSLGVQALMADRGQDLHVAVTDDAAARIVETTGQAWHAEDDGTTVTATRTTADAARAAVLDGSADGWLHQQNGVWTLTTEGSGSASLLTHLAATVRTEVLSANASAAGTTPDKILAGTQLMPDPISKDGASGDSEIVQMIMRFALAFLVYMASLLFGLSIAQSVVEEKQSRVVEILATAIPVRHILVGKVLANTLLAVGQMVLFVGVGLIGLSFTSYRSLIPSLSGTMLWFLVFFLAAFIALACLWAVGGSLASRHEDLQSTTTPMQMLLMLTFFLGMSATGVWLVVASYVPVLSSVTMPARLMSGEASWVEGVISLLITVVFAVLTVRVGERLYRRSVMQSGGRVGLKQAWRLAD